VRSEPKVFEKGIQIPVALAPGEMKDEGVALDRGKNG
jgi:hypothetical protein